MQTFKNLYFIKSTGLKINTYRLINITKFALIFSITDIKINKTKRSAYTAYMNAYATANHLQKTVHKNTSKTQFYQERLSN